MSSDPLDILWQCADRSDPVLVPEDFDDEAQIASFQKSGIIRLGAPATHVTCYDCSENHDAEVIPLPCSDGTARFFIVCPENGRIEISSDRLRTWRVAWKVVAEGVAAALATGGPVREIASQRVWNLGHASLAGRSRPVWVVRGLDWADARAVVGTRVFGRAPVVFFIGQPPEAGVLDVQPDSLFDLRMLLRLGDGFEMNRDVVDGQLVVSTEGQSKARRPKRRRERAATIDGIKREYRKHILSMKSAIRYADEHDQTFRPPRLEQKDLAKRLGVSESSISRAIRDSNDLELRQLVEMSADADRIRDFVMRGRISR